MRKLYSSLIALIFLCIGVPHFKAEAQKKKFQFQQKITNEVLKPEVSYDSYQFNFPNINKQLRYSNPNLLKEIYNLENKIASTKNPGEKQFFIEKLVPLLEQYVGNFGIQNFYYDTKWLWKLGQAYERTNQIDKAKSLYRLTLKHHRDGDINKIARYYDSVTVNSQDYYVPLNYYYELVEYRRSVDTLRPPHSVLTPMSENINSPKHPDYAPTLSKNNDTLIFTSKRKVRKRDLKRQLKEDPKILNEDLYMARYVEGFWEESTPLKDLNSEYNEGSAALSKTGKKIYFTRCDGPEGYGNCDLYEADWEVNSKGEGKWNNVRNLGPGVNGIAWESQPSLSHTEDTLFFASNRLGGFGLSDIYFSVKDKKSGRWGTAQNMGPVINTRLNEVSPFYHPVFHILYFSSDGHLLNFGDVEVYNNMYKPYFTNTGIRKGFNPKFGKPSPKNTFDIFKSYHVGDQFQEPKNIGPLVNGAGDEYYFTIDSKSQLLYYSRSEDSTVNNHDIFSFPLPMEAQPLATTRLSGQLTDSSGLPFRSIVAIIDITRGIEVAPKALRPDGSFDFDLIKNSNYILVIQGDEFFRIEEFFTLTGDTSIVKKAKKITDTKITFRSIQFYQGSDEILPSMYEDLENIINFMIDNPRFKLRISGHTDKTGIKSDNLKLSQARANAIKTYLTEGGIIKPWRIEAVGYGDTKPLVPEEKTEADREKNRRVEFELLAPRPGQ